MQDLSTGMENAKPSLASKCRPRLLTIKQVGLHTKVLTLTVTKSTKGEESYDVEEDEPDESSLELIPGPCII